METLPAARHLRVFCPTHQIIFEAAENPQIFCEIRQHALSNDFPQSEFWEYCCDCRTFFPSNLETGEKSKPACPRCQRLAARRFICDSCKVISFDSDEDTARKDFQITRAGAVEPTCPGCRKAFSGVKLFRHQCAAASTIFYTPREICPFCRRQTLQTKLVIVQQKTQPVRKTVHALQKTIFPVSAKDYVEKVRHESLTAVIDHYTNLLVHAPNKGDDFLIVKEDSSGENLFYAVPNINRLTGKVVFMAYYQNYYLCRRMSNGLVWIKSPAIVESVDKGWRLLVQGEIEMR